MIVLLIGLDLAAGFTSGFKPLEGGVSHPCLTQLSGLFLDLLFTLLFFFYSQVRSGINSCIYLLDQDS